MELYKIKNDETERLYSYSNLKTASFMASLRDEALDKNTSLERAYKYGFITAKIDEFLYLLFKSEQLLSTLETKYLEENINIINELRKTNLNKKEYIEYIDTLTKNFIKEENLEVIENKSCFVE